MAFLLANKLSSAAMISTQVQSLILDALDKDPSIGRSIRADIMVSQHTISRQFSVFLEIVADVFFHSFHRRPFAIVIPPVPVCQMYSCISRDFMHCKPTASLMPSGRRTTNRCWRITFNRKCPKRFKSISTQTLHLVRKET